MAAMAEDDIADCNGLSWSELATKLDLKSSDCEDVITPTPEATKTDTESMKLKKEEMMLYGLCPAQDEFFLVICEYCHLLIKPQALQYHMDVRHQDYSTSQVHNCAIPLSAIDPLASRNAKCSSHKTNSSISAQSTNSTTGKPTTRPARPKGRPSTKGAKNISEKPKPHSIDATPSESNAGLDKIRTGLIGAEKDPVLLRVAPTKTENAPGNAPVPTEIILPPSLGAVVKAEPKETVVFEPTHLKISEEKEALVKLLESNEWCDIEIKLEKEEKDGLDVKSSFLHPDTNHPLKPRTCESSSHVSEVVTTATSTCVASKSSGVSTTSGVAAKSVVSNAKPGLSKSETTCSVASLTSTTRTLGDRTVSLGKAIALMTDSSDEVAGNSLVASKSEKKSDPSQVVAVATQVKSETDLSSDVSTVAQSLSNVISKVQLKNSRSRKSPSKFLLCKDREFDANKHCGVWIEEIHKQCTRSLTCKSHSLSLRRAVPGRSKLFDQLLSEQRERKLTTKDKSTKFITKLKDKAAATAPNSTDPAAPISGASASSSSSSILTNSSAGSSQEVVPPADKPKKPVPVRHAKSLPSNSREDLLAAPSVVAREEKIDDGVKEERSVGEESSTESSRHCTMSHHPHPAAVNGFSSWVYGRGCYVFNRKEDLYRAAFLAAVERHLHPPPHKKLCLESNLPTDASIAKDPYDFLLLDGGQSQLHDSLSPNASTKPKPKQTTSSAQPATSERRPSTSSCSSTAKRPAPDPLENKRKLPKSDAPSPNDPPAKPTPPLPTDTVAAATPKTSVHLVLPARVDPTTSLSNGQMLGIPIAEMVAAQRKTNTELRIARPLPPHLNKTPARMVPTVPTSAPTSAPSRAVPLAAKVAPGYGGAPNAGIRLELRPDGAKLSAESLISNSGQRPLAPSDCVTVCARSSSCGGAVGNSLLKPATSLITTSRIPNILLTSSLPNGTVKLSQRNAPINSSNQTSLAAILALNHATNAKFAPLSESQAFITSSISNLGKANQAAVVPSPDNPKQLSLSAHVSTTLQLQSAIASPTAPTRSGFNVTSAGSALTNRQYIFASGVRHMYQAPVSTTPKKPLAASRVQLLRPELAPAGKTAASTTPLLASSKCHISGQPI